MVTFFTNTPQTLIGGAVATESATSVAALADGGYVVAWVGFVDGGQNVYARRYDALGRPASAIFRVDSDNSTAQTYSQVEVVGLAGGGFAFAWTEHRLDRGANAPAPGYTTTYTYWRAYDEGGAPIFENRHGRTYTTDPSNRGDVSISMTAKADGGFRVVSYADYEQRFKHIDVSATGSWDMGPSAWTTTQPYVNATDISAIGSLQNGGSVVAWVGTGTDGDGDGSGVFLQIANAAGGIVKPKTQVNTGNVGAQDGVDLLVRDDGSFIVTWTSSNLGIRLQRYTADGNRIGSETVVSTSGHSSDIAALSDGGYVVIWESSLGDIYAQRYSAGGARVGTEILVEDSPLFPVQADVAGLAGGGFVVTWRTGDLGNQDVYSRTIRSPSTADTMTGAIEIVVGTSGGDIIRAAPGSFGAQDIVYGGGGIDRIQLTAPGTLDLTKLRGFVSIERLYGTEGNDTFIVSNARLQGIDVVSLGAGVNSFRYVETSATTFTLGAGWTVGDMRAHDASSTFNTNYTGNALAQTITGNAGDNVIRGEGGNDRLVGLGGDDTLHGGAGNDILIGGPGEDTLYGGTGNDTYFVENNADSVREFEGEGTDTVLAASTFGLIATASIEFLRTQNAAGTEAIELRGSDFGQTIQGNAGNNRLYGRGGNDVLDGLAGNDILDGGEGNDILRGGAGADTMDGGNGSDTYHADASDTIVDSGTTGIDTVIAAAGFRLTVGDGIENLRTTSTGAVSLHGNEQGNVITGGAGADTLWGLDGNDTLRGGAGNDTLRGGKGGDRLYGEAGADTFQFLAGDSLVAGERDIIMDFTSGTDRVDLAIFSGTSGAPASAYHEIKIASDSFSALKAAAEGQLTGSTRAVFVAGNSHGWLFWTTNGGDGTAEEVVQLHGRNSLGHFAVTDLV